MRGIRAWTLLGISCVAMGCGDVELQGEDYGDLLSSPSGLALTQDEHSAGWGKSDCTMCHNMNNIHLEDRTGTGIDMSLIRETVFTDGLTSCAACHGTNGVP